MRKRSRLRPLRTLTPCSTSISSTPWRSAASCCSSATASAGCCRCWRATTCRRRSSAGCWWPRRCSSPGRAASTLVTFDTRLQAPLMIAFFTTVGFGASLSLLQGRRAAGAALLAARDGARGASRTSSASLIALPLGHASAVRRAERIGDADRRTGDRPGVRAGVRAGGRARRRDGRGRRGDGRHRRRAGSSAGRSARCSIERYKLRQPRAAPVAPRRRRSPRRSSRTSCRAGADRAPPGEDKESYALLKALVVILVAMWIGSLGQRAGSTCRSASRCRPTSARCWSPRSSATSTMRPG